MTYLLVGWNDNGWGVNIEGNEEAVISLNAKTLKEAQLEAKEMLIPGEWGDYFVDDDDEDGGFFKVRIAEVVATVDIKGIYKKHEELAENHKEKEQLAAEKAEYERLKKKLNL